MNRALFSGLSSTVAHQTRLDVAANNLANVSTVGYKASRTTFVDAFYNTLRSGMAPSETRGGVSPMQVGAGVSVGATSVVGTQGALQRTGQSLDAAIDGAGMMVVHGPAGEFYTRDGSMDLDESNTLVMASTGLRVQGWMATDGAVTSSDPVTDLSFPLRSMRSPKATALVSMEGNLPSDRASTDPALTSSVTVYDSLGETHTVALRFTKTATPLEWTIEATLEGTTASSTVTFAADGSLPAGTAVSLLGVLPPSGAAAMDVSVDLSKVTQYATGNEPSATSQDGYGAASLEGIAVVDGGAIQGNYSDGRSMVLGKLAVTTFANCEGLNRSGNNLFAASASSGVPHLGASDEDGRGKIIGSSLEQSNTDLTSSFLEMLITQRAYQASTRVISTANSLLEEAIQLAGR